jgi:chromosome segregation ATPase
MDNLLPDKVMEILAINLGLLILLVWFFVLLLIIREFRKFASKFTHGTMMDNKTLTLCQQSVDEALDYSSVNGDTLNELILIQQALEAQVVHLKTSGAVNPSPDDQASIDELNHKLNQSHQLIRKLKNDLDKSSKGLQVTKQKLYAQYDTVESLRAQKSTIEKDFSLLEQEYIRITKSAAANNSERNGGANNLNNDLSSTKSEDKASSADNKALRQQLESVQQSIQHLAKEKDFVEKRYLDLLSEVEQKNSDNS